MKKSFSLRARGHSFKYAISGLKTLFLEEPNAQFHGLAAIGVVCAGFYFELSSFEWIAIWFCIGFVFFAELINTALENLCDFVSPAKNEYIRKAKDLAAAAVLVSALISIAVAFLIFYPKLRT